MEIGDTKRGKEIGYKSLHTQYIWLACNCCGKERWVNFYRTKHPNYTGCCVSCMARSKKFWTGENHWNWKGGKYLATYSLVRCPNEFSSMANAGGYVLEHRLIMAKYLGRPLANTEVIHHLNGVPTDNRKENLVIVDSNSHERHTLNNLLKVRIRQLELVISKLIEQKEE